MDYTFSYGTPITEEEALSLAAAMSFHSLAFDLVVDEDEPLHWHEFNSVSWVIDGTGAFRDETGKVTEVGPGCRLDAPAGWLHANLAGPAIRIVLATDIPYEQWTMPIDKDPSLLSSI
jgi:hypothetical protein